MPATRRIVVAAAAGAVGSSPLSEEADALLCSPPLFAVAADETRPRQEGASLAIETLRRVWTRSSGPDGLIGAIETADRRIRELLPDRASSDGVALLAAVLTDRGVTLARAGTTTWYLFRAGSVAHMGTSPSPAPLGGAGSATAELSTLSVRLGDLVLLCSRGPTGGSAIEWLVSVVRAHPHPRDCAPVLARELSVQRGSAVTVAAFRLGEMLNQPRARSHDG